MNVTNNFRSAWKLRHIHQFFLAELRQHSGRKDHDICSKPRNILNLICNNCIFLYRLQCTDIKLTGNYPEPRVLSYKYAKDQLCFFSHSKSSSAIFDYRVKSIFQWRSTFRNISSLSNVTYIMCIDVSIFEPAPLLTLNAPICDCGDIVINMSSV